MADLYGRNGRAAQMKSLTSAKIGSTKSNKNFIIKTAMVIFLVCYLGFLYFSDYAKNIPMEQITTSMEAAPSVTALQKRGRNDLNRYYQIKDADTNGYVFYKAVSPMSVDELFIVKAPDKAVAESFLENAQAHLESQKNVFGGYGTDQMALLNEALVGSQGNYVYYFCGADATAWYDAFLSLI